MIIDYHLNLTSADGGLDQFDYPEDEFEENILLQEKTDDKRIKERKRKNVQQQFSIFDLMDFSDKEEKNLTEKLIEHELKRGSGFERGKMRICHEYDKNPAISEFAGFLKDEYGLGGHSDGIYGAMHDATGIRMVMRDKKDYHNILAQAELKWNEVAVRIADLIDDDEYLTAEEKIEFANYQAQRYGSDEERIKAIADWMAETGTRYTCSGHYNNYNHGNNYQFVKNHQEDIQKELERRKEVEKVSYGGIDGFNVWFKKEFCSRYRRKCYGNEMGTES